jgi:hypothetical protein
MFGCERKRNDFCTETIRLNFLNICYLQVEVSVLEYVT